MLILFILLVQPVGCCGLVAKVRTLGMSFQVRTSFFLYRDGCKHPTKSCLNYTAGELQGDPYKKMNLKNSPAHKQGGPLENDRTRSSPWSNFPRSAAGLAGGLRQRSRGRTTWCTAQRSAVEEARSSDGAAALQPKSPARDGASRR
jgi:hypothetical protein